MIIAPREPNGLKLGDQRVLIARSNSIGRREVTVLAKILSSIVLVFGITLVATVSAFAQTPTPSPTPQVAATTAPPQTNPSDVATMDAIVTALYDVISGPPGKRDWDRFRSLFYPGARLIPTGIRPTGEAGSRVLSPNDYAARSGPLLEKNGFFEREISRRTERFANIAHLFSTYESRHAKEDEKPFARGINSIQMMNDGKRWWILSIFWQAEDPKNQLPAEYLRTRN